MEEQSVNSPVKSSLLSKVIKVISNLLFSLILVLCLLLVFSLVQMKVSGGPARVAGYQLYIVLSGSMRPAFDTGSLVLVEPADPEEIESGDIITYKALGEGQELVSHRVIAVHNSSDGITFTTKGDANDVADPNPIPAANIIGKVILAIPYLGYLLDYTQTKHGLVTLIIIPALILLVFESRNLYRQVQALKKEKTL